jgi:hypothetical protein
LRKAAESGARRARRPAARLLPDLAHADAHAY